jgi:hypothetical protein
VKGQCVEQGILSLEDLVLGFMGFCQRCHGIKDFAPFNDPIWAFFLFFVTKELGNKLPQALDVRFFLSSNGTFSLSTRDYENILCALNFTTRSDSRTKRIFLDIEDDVWGIKLGKRYWKLANDMFLLGMEFKGLMGSA